MQSTSDLASLVGSGGDGDSRTVSLEAIFMGIASCILPLSSCYLCSSFPSARVHAERERSRGCGRVRQGDKGGGASACGAAGGQDRGVPGSTVSDGASLPVSFSAGMIALRQLLCLNETQGAIAARQG